MEKTLHIYEVGMGSDLRKIQAPNAGAAAMYYSIACVETNNPFMAAVYTEDGEKFTGESSWLNIQPDYQFAKEVMARVGADLHHCSVVED